MPRQRRARAPATVAVLTMAAAVGTAVFAGAALATNFLPGPTSGARRQPNAAQEQAGGLTAAGIAAGLSLPLGARAELPPLEDLPLEGLKGDVVSAAMEPISKKAESWSVGVIQGPVFLLGVPLFLFPIGFAVSWAFTWVTNTEPFNKDYKTYLGAGMMPPEGYTNPLDPRCNPQKKDDDSSSGGDSGGTSPYKEYKASLEGGPKGRKAAKSAIV
eukprot:CAMPEP_0115187418 /NCGR_PEP_ID=MMETSP0270-20121206/10483_1 /TAXON_ID=71861 /ORGANISM="Scrippsiella trochoidea, Strain CCMP3099" /LENGTH=214 /DNA_ID=CAMNT_0002600565 /DNA_START=8 /DNA_END=652 /DNA_ORIENTATION=+